MIQDLSNHNDKLRQKGKIGKLILNKVRGLAPISVLIMTLLFGYHIVSRSLSPQTISGVAAAGAALEGLVKIKDASTPSQEKVVVIGSDGSFIFDVSNMKGPFILQAVGTVDGTNYTLHSFADSTGIANINPLSNVAVAAAAKSDDPGEIYANSNPVTLQKVKLNLGLAVTTLQSKLKPLFNLYGVTSTDPIKDHFRVHHSGLDDLLDDLKFFLTNDDLKIVDVTTGTDIFTSKVAYIYAGKFLNLPAHL